MKWLARGETGSGTVVQEAAAIAALRRASFIDGVDFNSIFNQKNALLDSEGRLFKFKSLRGVSFIQHFTASTAAYDQFTDWSSVHRGVTMGGAASNRGCFISEADIFPASGDLTVLAIGTQTTGVDGNFWSNNDAASMFGCGFLSTNAMRIRWGANTYDPASTTNAGARSAIITSFKTGSPNKLRQWFNNVEKDDRTPGGAFAPTNKELVVGALTNGTVGTGHLDGTHGGVWIWDEAGDDGDAFISIVKAFADSMAPEEGWPTT